MADKAKKLRAGGPVLKVHHLRPAPGAKTAKTRVGRGEGGKGKTAGRGTKGTKARYQVPEALRGWADAAAHAAARSCAASRTRSASSTRWSTWTSSRALFPERWRRDGRRPRRQGRGPQGPARQGARHRRDHGQGLVAVDAFSASAKDKIVAAGGTVAQD